MKNNQIAKPNFKLIKHHIPSQAAQVYIHAMILAYFFHVTAWAQALSSAVRNLSSLYNQALKIMAK